MSQSGQSTAPQMDGWQGRLEYASISDIGLRRTNNQDSLAVMPASSQNLWQQCGDLFVVADGMGAHAAGELASKISTDTVPLVYQKLIDRTPAEAALTAVEEANARIHSRGQASVDFHGMGTTTTALALLPYGALLAHVGDSRAYRLRGTRLEQLTFDHSLVWEMRAAGAAKVPDFIPKNVITRSLGPNPSVQVDLEGPLPIVPGDTYMMCSDGLSGQITDEELGMLLGSLPPCEAVKALVDLANLRGGPDNITVIIAKTLGSFWTQAASDRIPRPKATLRAVNPAVWIVAGVLGLAGMGALLLQLYIPAAVGLVAAILAAASGLIYRQSGETQGPEMNGQRYGRGPYSATICTPSVEFVAHLAGVLRELRDAASQADLTLNVEGLHASQDRATAANQAGDFSQAIRFYCQAISFVLGEFKRQGKPPGRRGK